MAGRKPIRIVFCEGNVDGTIGGSYYSLLYLIQGLDRSRFTPIVVFHREHPMLARFQAAGAETLVWPRSAPLTFSLLSQVKVAPFTPVLQVARKGLNFLRSFVLQAARQALYLRRVDAHIVHLNNSILRNQDWMLAARLAGLKVVSHERGINDVYDAAARFWAKHVDAIICISHAVRRQLEAHGLDHGQLTTIHNGFDPAEARFQMSPEELRAVHRLPREARVLVMAGNIKRWKGQETVIRAMAKVRSAHPAARCLFVGAASPDDRPFESAMRALVTELGLDDRVTFVGFRENVADYMRLAEVVIHASVLPEPFGRVALEAMACRKPVVGTDAGGMAEVIANGTTGLTFPSGSAECLADAVNWMLAHPEDAARMGEHGYARLLEHFPIAANVRATEHLYDTLLAARALVNHRSSQAPEERDTG